MNVDVEDLLRSGMERLTDEVRAPLGLAARAARVRSRRKAARLAAGASTAAVVTAVAVIAATGAASPAPAAPVQARPAAYVIKQVEKALAGEHLVFHGHTTSNLVLSGPAADNVQPSSTWAYGHRSRFEEFTGNGCGHALADGSCTHQGGSERYLAQGTALSGGKLTGVYVTYFDRKWSGGGSPYVEPSNACSTTGAMEMGGPPIPTNRWSAFINASLACGAATVTGHVRINGVETTKITGAPVTVKLAPGEAGSVREKQARVRWTLYVNPTTYLPVRISGSTQAFGGPAASTLFASVTDVQWLPPTRANIAKALVTIPAGFRRVSSPANQ
jgi:hypothetical protein